MCFSDYLPRPHFDGVYGQARTTRCGPVPARAEPDGRPRPPEGPGCLEGGIVSSWYGSGLVFPFRSLCRRGVGVIPRSGLYQRCQHPCSARMFILWFELHSSRRYGGASCTASRGLLVAVLSGVCPSGTFPGARASFLRIIAQPWEHVSVCDIGSLRILEHSSAWRRSGGGASSRHGTPADVLLGRCTDMPLPVGTLTPIPICVFYFISSFIYLSGPSGRIFNTKFHAFGSDGAVGLGEYPPPPPRRRSFSDTHATLASYLC